MKSLYGTDAYSPEQIAEQVETVGVKKANLPLLKMSLLGGLAGGFIALGAMFFTLVVSDSTLSFAVSRLLGGLVFSMGLVLVVVAGAELFTGNNLLVMAWVHRRISVGLLLRNFVVVYFANLAGALVVAVLVYHSGHLGLNNGSVGEKAVAIAIAKTDLPLMEMFFRGILCNILVCLAVWLAAAGRQVVNRGPRHRLPHHGLCGLRLRALRGQHVFPSPRPHGGSGSRPESRHAHQPRRGHPRQRPSAAPAWSGSWPT